MAINTEATKPGFYTIETEHGFYVANSDSTNELEGSSGSDSSIGTNTSGSLTTTAAAVQSVAQATSNQSGQYRSIDELEGSSGSDSSIGTSTSGSLTSTGTSTSGSLTTTASQLQPFEQAVRRESETASSNQVLQTVTFQNQNQAEINIGQKLGNGAFGAAYKATNVQNGEEKALKYNFQLLEPQNIALGRPNLITQANGQVKVPGEVYGMTLTHPHILPVEGVVTQNPSGHEYWNKENLDINSMMNKELRMSVSPFVSGGDAGRFLNPNNPIGNQLFPVLLQMADGVSYIHRNGMIHGDLKPDNTFVDNNGNVKIGDLGSLQPQMGTEHIRGGRFANGYSAPECHANKRKRDQKSDAFSFGITACELALGKSVTSDFEKATWSSKMKELAQNNPDGSYLDYQLSDADKAKLDADYPGLRPLLNELTMINPFKRISVEQFQEKLQQYANAFAFGITVCEWALETQLSDDLGGANSSLLTHNNNPDGSYLDYKLSDADKAKLDANHPGLRPLLYDLTTVNPFKRISVGEFIAKWFDQ